MKSRATFLVSTHIMSIAERLTSKCIIISAGLKVWEGTIPDLRKGEPVDTPIESIVARLMTNAV